MTLPDRSFGIELEYEIGNRVLDHDRRVSFLQRAGFAVSAAHGAPPPAEAHVVAKALATAGYNAYALPASNKCNSVWRVFADQSGGIEITTPIQRGERDLERVRGALSIMAGAGCTTAEGLGLHVHVGAADLSLREVQSVARLAAHLEPLLVRLLPAQRREVWVGCRRTVAECLPSIEAARSFDGLFAALGSNRVVTWNLRPLRTYGTLECRLPPTTLDADEVEMWVRIALGVVHEGRRRRVAPGTNPMMTLLSLRTMRPVRGWVLDRVRAAA